VRVALMIEGQEGVTWEQWLALALACEEHGIEKLCRSDHYLSMSDPSGKHAFDAWTTLAALAAATTKVRLGTLVSPVTFRHPALLANAVATIDQISGGRVELGLGAGWNTREHEAFGFPFPEARERTAIFAEQLEIVHRLWTEDSVDFEGTHYTLKGAPGLPKPVQQPHPPIIVGGGGKRGTAVPAARFADQYDVPFRSAEEVAEIVGRVRAACEAEGRDPATMRFSVMGTIGIGDAAARRLWELGIRFGHDTYDAWYADFRGRAFFGTVDEIAARIREYGEAGADQVMLQHLLHGDLETVAVIGREIAPAVA
jgi:F420-dependent oxidoreductase-like protein